MLSSFTNRLLNRRRFASSRRIQSRAPRPRLSSLFVEPLEQRHLLAVSPLGFLQGTSFVDANGNNQLDPTESYKPGATIELRSADGSTVLATQTTDANGAYLFDDLTPGTYRLVEIPTSGYTNQGTQILSQVYPATPISPNTIQVTVLDSSKIYVKYNGVGPNFETVHSELFGSPEEQSVGQLKVALGTTPGNNDISTQYTTFCVDLLHQLNFSGGATFQVLPNPITGLTDGTFVVSADHAGRVAYLYNHYGTGPLTSVQAGALQIAMHELIYDLTTDTSAGNYRIISRGPTTTAAEFAAMMVQANAYLSESAGESETAIFLDATLGGEDVSEVGRQGVVAKGSFNFANVAAELVEISGRKFEDENGDGLGAGDAGLAGWTIFLDLNNNGGLDLGEPNTVTGAGGAYSFTGLTAGTYIVREVGQGGWVQTAPGPGFYSVTIAGGGSSPGNDFGNFDLVEISGRKFEDENGDGLGAGDAGLAGWTIFLDLNNNGGLDLGEPNTVTGAGGAYSFTGLTAGTYIVREVGQGGWVQTAPGAGHFSVTATSGDDSPGNDFGNFDLVEISGRKFEDENGDGLGAGDAGLAGWTIFLDLDNSGTLDLGEPSTVTGAGGAYSFTGLTAGTYIVREVGQGGWVQTAPGAGHFSVTTTSGDDSTGNDFGNFDLVEISGRKFEDENGDGLGAGDAGLAGWTIFLDLNNNGGLDLGEPNTVTGAGGAYSFTGLTSGTYIVREVGQGGWVQTAPGAGHFSVTATSGDDSPGNDFGNFDLVEISGRKFEDENGDGLGAGDAGLAGWTIFLDLNNSGGLDVGEPSTVTGAGGAYSFTGLTAGTYIVREVGQAGWTQTAPGAGHYSVTATSGDDATGKDFGNIDVVDLSGRKFEDKNGDGSGSGDPGLSGWTIFLDLNNNGALNAGEPSTVTGAGGSYSFSNLAPGTYTVREVGQTGWLQTAPSTGKHTVTISSGTNVTGKDFGNFDLVDLSGRKFEDKNGDGNGSGDPGLSGWTIFLDLNNNGALNAGEPSTVTGAGGAYSFTNLAPGTYTVREVGQSGWTQTAPSTGKHTVTVSSGYNVTGKDFGNFDLVEISGRKFEDKNGDGSGYGDPGLSGWTIFLDLNNNGSLDSGEPSTVTGAGGAYAFANLGPGTYTVREVGQAGWIQTAPSSGKYTITVSSGYDVCDKDFGNKKQKGEISGQKFKDLTGNGLSSDDTGLGGTTIKLYRDANNNGEFDAGDGGSIAYTTSASGTGAYSFTNLSFDTYFVQEVVPSGYVRTAPALSSYYTVDLTSSNAVVEDRDFANFKKGECDECTLSDIKYIINGTKTVDDLRGNTNEGDEVTVVFTVNPGYFNIQFSLVSYVAPGPTFDANTAHLQTVYDVDTGFFGPGTHSLTVTNPSSYFQIDFVCGAVIDQFGPAGSSIFYTPQDRLFSADNDGTRHQIQGNDSTIKGRVYVDTDNDGYRDSGEAAIPGVTVKLTGTTNGGQSVNLTDVTDSNGIYKFANLLAGTYVVTETQPAGFLDGKANAKGNSGGAASGANKFVDIVLTQGFDAYDYNFGEKISSGCGVFDGQAASLEFWRGDDGQALIKSLNGGSSSKSLATWLSTTFGNMYGSSAGSKLLVNKTNSDVAALFRSLYDSSNDKLDANALATALSIYVTDSDYAGTAAVQYGFIVTTAGLGASTYSVGANGAAFGLANYTTKSVLDLLKAVNTKTKSGWLYDLDGNKSISSSEQTSRNQAKSVLSGILSAGD